jgi:RNA polymerase sigma-70 factor (ECF subfamily)
MEAALIHGSDAKRRTHSTDPLAALVIEIADGDERALRTLYDATSAQVFGWCLAVLRERDAAEEAVVEVYAQVWRQAERYDPSRGCVASWIATLARTRSIDLSRTRERQQDGRTPLDPALADLLPDPGPAPDEASFQEERAARVRRALDSLPADQKRAVEAAFFLGLSHTEVADALRLPLGTVKTRIRSGLSALRRALASTEGEIA